MTAQARVEVERIADDADGGPRVRLLLGGRDTAWTLPGAVLEGAFAYGDETLVLLSDDVPFEEGLHVCLIDSEGALLDEVYVGHVGTPATVRAVIEEAPGRVSFGFFGDGRIEVCVLPKPRVMLPQPGLTSGISRRGALRGRLVVTARPTSGD